MGPGLLAAFEMLILKPTWATSGNIFEGARALQAWKHDFDEDRKKIQENRVEEKIPQVLIAPSSLAVLRQGQEKLFSDCTIR